MEFEFDKEIDALLRQTAQGETAPSAENLKSKIQNPKPLHLDADEIAAFAENALPEKTRLNYVSHLADCARCRKILSGLIALNAETQSEIIHRAEPQTLAATAPEIPWYRKFFAVPTLAYAMGALILVFTGIGVFTITQNDSGDSEVSRTYEKQPGGKGMASDGDAAAPESSSKSMSNQATTNSAVSTNATANAANSAAAIQPEPYANSNSTIRQRGTNQESREELTDDQASPKPGKPNETAAAIAGGSAPPAAPPTTTSNESELDEEAEKTPSQNQTQTQTAQNQSQITPDARNVQRAPAPSAKVRKQETQLADEAKKDDKKEKFAEPTRVGGKSFTRDGNLWVDAAYRGQATTNISRGTKEYRKLDSGLRGIVENLGGTVIVVWKEKAYRIQ